MRYVIWLLRAALLFILLIFSIKNDQPVVLHYLFGYEWRSPLILILWMFFAIGMGIGVLATLSNTFKQRREIYTLRRELKLRDVPIDSNNIDPYIR